MGARENAFLPRLDRLSGRASHPDLPFQEGLLFHGGGNGINSQDSRYWGLLPEEYIVGKVWKVWKSVDPYTDRFRWDRFLLDVK